ncbi:CBASS cGAMP synthase [Agrobacterium vitis]|uniref:CBASS cGAMP synthase n=1 Tax=Agrobacterium vitis TaxID=373 RepID=UPI00087305BB|nr:nucleotidyltransferase [Agrobacterium vitis]MCE6074260.1 hypothetical protein [Agrobacterium vitis]MCM2471685.1 nucleotidyltransferase [Agrobacterium vitis]MUO73529.1 hypothetical protein [Agrobacterium vitis]MUO87041.1 hypothetical protein [Agrobacterium vitis]MVA35919.1 hypothetical protein [Agrobacterium vitis]
MPQSAKLFYQAGSESETLHRRITPTAHQFTAQKDRWNDLAEFFVKRLTEDSGYSIRTWLQGSYKFRTQIRPWVVGAEFDIDLGIYFEWKGEPEDGDHTPGKLKTLVQKALVDYQDDENNDATGVADPKERCCRIVFAPDFHIDVPCYHLDSERDARTLATETKGWEVSDPKQIYEWFKNCQDDVPRKKLRRLIRYLKMWAALRIEEAERPSSILLTVLAAEAFDSFDLDVVVDDDEILEQAATVIADRLDGDPIVPNPVNSHEDVNRLEVGAVVKLVAKLRDLASVGERARLAADISAAAEIWSEAFDQFFPMPEDTEEGMQALAKSQAIAVYAYAPDIVITATPRNNRDVKPIQGFNEIRPVPKDCDINFTIARPDLLPAGCTLKWTVRNHGREAAMENDMGHVAGTGISVERHTAYNGDHAMDLTIFLDGRPVGRRRITVKVRGPAIPPRNPPRRQYGR